MGGPGADTSATIGDISYEEMDAFCRQVFG